MAIDERVSTRLRIGELLRERRWTTKVLSDKTGISPSYLTHMKNGTRRWNEDALRKLAVAFELHPAELFADRRARIEPPIDHHLEGVDEKHTQVKIKVVPVMSEIPSHPSPYNNQVTQIASGYRDVFMPVSDSDDENMFCLHVADSSMTPNFVKNDYLIISPQAWSSSGDIVAVEYGNNENPTRSIMQVNYMDEFIVLESVNHKKSPVALVRGKDMFRTIGKVIYRYQKLG